MKHIASFFLCLFPASGGDVTPASVITDGWEWSVSVGPAVRNIGALKINAGSRSAGILLPSLVGSGSLVAPPIGETDAYAERMYEDGYVRQDAGTSADGSTWYWGYESAGQIQGDSLLFSARGSESVVRGDVANPGRGAYSRDSLAGFSPHLQLDVKSPHSIGGFRIGFSGGFDFTKVDQSLVFSDFSASQFRDNFRLDYTDIYALGGVVLPGAPYSGSLGGPGPLIGNLPTDRIVTPVLLSTDSAFFANEVSASLDMDVSSLTLGPSLSRSLGALEFAMQAGVILNVYRWDARQTEKLSGTAGGTTGTTAVWADGGSGTKFRPGVYTQADIAYALNENLSVGTFARLDVAREFRVQAGPTIFKVDPTGFSTGFQIRYALP